MKRISVFLALSVVVALACQPNVTGPASSSGPDGAIAAQTNGFEPVLGRMSVGGQIREGSCRISFGGNVQSVAEYTVISDADWWVATDPQGQLVMQFHHVSNQALDRRTFKSTHFENFRVHPSVGGNCEFFGLLTAIGRLDGEPGWQVLFRGMDAGRDARPAEGSFDTVRIQVTDPAGVLIYDSWDQTGMGDFPGESNCAGQRRQKLDSGNIVTSMKPIHP